MLFAIFPVNGSNHQKNKYEYLFNDATPTHTLGKTSHPNGRDREVRIGIPLKPGKKY